MRHSGAEQSEEPGIHIPGVLNSGPTRGHLSIRGYGFRARGLARVPE
jgi:hypothetical protein